MNANENTKALSLLLAGMARVARDAELIVAVCTVVALTVNATIHPRSIPFIAKKAYETLVPCPEPGGAVGAVESSAPEITASDTFRVDARDSSDFSAWHLKGAMNVTYDYLDPTPKDVLEKLAKRAAASRAQRVVVYGDGDDPDSGEQLGKEISGHGIKNVFFVKGGAPALKKARRQ